MKRLILALALSVGACAPAAPAAPPPHDAATCHFERSRTLYERSRDLDSPSPAIALDATAAVLAESCSGALASIARRLAEDPIVQKSRDAHGVLCDTAELESAADAILTSALASDASPACFSSDRKVARACAMPWAVLSLWESPDEWAESRFFPESERPVPAAVVLGPRFALASAIVSHDRSFVTRSLAAHVLVKRDPQVLDAAKTCRDAE